MGDIYVDVGPMDSSKAPKEYAAKVKRYLDDTVTGAVDKAKGFTTKKEGEGYKLRVKVVELKLEGKGATCKLSGELTRYPKPEMVSTSITAGAKAEGGKPESLVKDCIEGAAEGIMEKVIPVMAKQAR
jgi:hypothetical protein